VARSGRTLANALADAGIEGPEDVSATNLAALPKVGPTRAGRTALGVHRRRSRDEVVTLIVPAGLDARIAVGP